MATTANLIGRVRYQVGQASTQQLQESDIEAHLNRAQEMLLWSLVVGAMPELTETVTGTLTASRVALPSDFAFEQAVEVGSPLVTCRPYAVSRLDALEDGLVPQFAPGDDQPYYYIWHNVDDSAVRLHIMVGDDASTDAYALRYVKLPDDLESGVTNPVFSDRLCDLLVDLAVVRCHENLKNYGEAQRRMKQVIDRIRIVNSRYQPGGQRHEGRPSMG